MAKKQFKAESKRLLDLMINSIYTHKEIFLREIISNASDAIDKLCYVALTDDKVGMNRSDFAITVSVDKENRTLTVSDNGIGMSREELENNLGVIASSGSYKFRQETEEKDKKDADIDIIGDGALDILNEAEIPAIIYDTFTRLGLHRFRIRVNNRKVLNGFFAILGLSEQAGDVLRTIDKLDKIGADKVRALLTDTCGVTSEQADEILRFIACPGTSADKLAFLEQYRGRNETFDTGLDELRTVVGYLPAFGVPEENFELDLTIARGLDYYTGTVYETVLLDHPEVGSICSGGRYDDLAGYYTNKSLPGVGISIGLTRLFYILQEQNMISDAVLTAPADVLILPMTDDLSAAVALASMLRAGGLRVQLYSERKKFKAKIGYADKLGIPFVIFLGEDEIAQHVCALKNMATGVQEAVTQETALETIRAEIARRSAGAILREP